MARSLPKQQALPRIVALRRLGRRPWLGPRALTWALVSLLTLGVTPDVLTAASQDAGVLNGKVSEGLAPPFREYTVQLRDVISGQVVSTTQLDDHGHFSFTGLSRSGRYIAELHSGAQRIVCAAGPYTLTRAQATTVDVNINCGGLPALRFLTGAAGIATAIVVAVRSRSQ